MAVSKIIWVSGLVVLVCLIPFLAYQFFKPAPLPEIASLDEWSFGRHPVPHYGELSEEDRKFARRYLKELPQMDYCEKAVAFRYKLYQKNNPRFAPFAGEPGAYQRFIHAGAGVAKDPSLACFATWLKYRVFEKGRGRCNFNVNREEGDPVLRADLDKMIELVEKRHQIMMWNLLFDATRIRSNAVQVETVYYLVQMTKVQGNLEIIAKHAREKVRRLSPERLRFIEEAAKRNDFRSVLRTNPSCRKDREDVGAEIQSAND